MHTFRVSAAEYNGMGSAILSCLATHRVVGLGKYGKRKAIDFSILCVGQADFPRLFFHTVYRRLVALHFYSCLAPTTDWGPYRMLKQHKDEEEATLPTLLAVVAFTLCPEIAVLGWGSRSRTVGRDSFPQPLALCCGPAENPVSAPAAN